MAESWQPFLFFFPNKTIKLPTHLETISAYNQGLVYAFCGGSRYHLSCPIQRIQVYKWICYNY